MINFYLRKLDAFLVHPTAMRRIAILVFAICVLLSVFYCSLSECTYIRTGITFEEFFTPFIFFGLVWLSYIIQGAIFFVIGRVLGGKGSFKHSCRAQLYCSAVLCLICFLVVVLAATFGVATAIAGMGTELAVFIAGLFDMAAAIFAFYLNAKTIAHVHSVAIWKVMILLLGIYFLFLFVGYVISIAALSAAG